MNIISNAVRYNKEKGEILLSYYETQDVYKRQLLSIVDEYPNPDLIGNARSASVMYDLAYVHLFVCKISENILVKW